MVPLQWSVLPQLLLLEGLLCHYFQQLSPFCTGPLSSPVYSWHINVTNEEVVVLKSKKVIVKVPILRNLCGARAGA
jgi:hypothetical protein